MREEGRGGMDSEINGRMEGEEMATGSKQVYSKPHSCKISKR